MNFIRRSTGKPLLRVHGIGGSWRSWHTILDTPAARREVIAIDLRGFGATRQAPRARHHAPGTTRPRIVSRHRSARV